MKIKMTLTKLEKIMGLLNQWDPEGRCADGEEIGSYKYEGETIVQEIRANSKIETIERVIMNAFAGTELDETEVHQMAEYIKTITKK